jgi:phosphomannomutase
MNYLDRYTDFLVKHLHIEEPIKAVFDCSNGTAGMVLEKIINKTDNLDTRLINENPDGTFPAHNPSPLAEGALDDLKKETTKESADVGVIFDPDVDRVFFVDEKGERVDPREVLALIAPLFKPPYIVNVALGKTPMNWIAPNLDIIETRTGHYFIKQIMRENEVELGVEHSGHYYFKEFFFADSGMFAALVVLSAVSKLKKEGVTLSGWRKALPEIYQSGELNFKIKDKENVLKNVAEHFQKKAEIKKIDGITIEGELYWANLRVSNTEPLLRLNIAARSNEELGKLKEEFLSLLQ